MKFLPLVWAGIWRKRSRSILIFVQVVIAFTLFGTLQGLNSAIRQAVDASHADRLYVGNRLRLGTPMPIAILSRLQGIPGVIDTTYRFAFGASYQNPRQSVPVVGVDLPSFLRMYPELQVEPAQAQAMQQRRDGALVGSESMRRFGWKAGQRISVKGQVPRKDGSYDWSFQILGAYQNRDAPDQAVVILANYSYLNESLAGLKDTIQLAVVRIADPARAGAVEQAIDSRFANSANETLTQSEHELNMASVENLGDMSVAVHRITAATFFILLFATGALMMQSIRERTPELAVLKTFGFSDTLVMMLILAETLLLCVGGAALGLWIASRILPLARGVIGLGSLPAIIVAAGFACAVALALAGGAIPAWRGLRLRVVDALANR